MTHLDLEIRILPRREGGYPVEITCGGDRELPAGLLDPAILSQPPGSMEEDGDRLFQLLFADPPLRDAWARTGGESRLRRVRLRIDPGAPELHAIPWELLREPGEPPRLLAAAADTPFSRYLAGPWRPGAPVLGRPVRLLLAVASPADLADYGVAPLDVAAERQALVEVFQGDQEEVEIRFVEPPVTLAALERALTEHRPHLVHLMAHGVVHQRLGGVALLLEDDKGRAAAIAEGELAGLVARLPETPRLVFLAACRSAERSPADAYRGVAPALVAAGVPAVLAMQAPVVAETARELAAAFYRRLLCHGRCDLAANEARSALLAAGLPGAAIPVLFQRLRDGALLGFRGHVLGPRSTTFWTTLLDNIADGECTPLLGPDLTEGLLPSPRDVAAALAQRHGYPFRDPSSLPRVAQFVRSTDPLRLHRDVLRLLTEGFCRRQGLPLPAGAAARDLTGAIRGARWPDPERGGDEVEVHRLLADLDLPLYLTTNFDPFMTLALEGRGRQSRRETLPWRDGRHDAGNAGPIPDLEPPPSSGEPVVLHLFGSDEDERSLVLTEDDHLDYLTRISRDHELLLPTSVAAALARTTLLFLGYRLHGFDLKILLRGLLSHLDSDQWSRLHVAVQVDERQAEESSYEEIKRYLEAYFGDSRIDVYWGSSRQFIAELHARWLERNHAA